MKKPERIKQSAGRHVAVDPKWLPSFSFSLFYSYILYIFISLCFLFSALPSLFLSEEVTVQRGGDEGDIIVLLPPPRLTAERNRRWAAPTRCSSAADMKLREKTLRGRNRLWVGFRDQADHCIDVTPTPGQFNDHLHENCNLNEAWSVVGSN